MTTKRSRMPSSSRWRALSLVLIGILAGTLLLGTASAHLTTFEHVKKKHFYTKKIADNRFVKRMWAVVDTDGHLVRGRGASGALRTGEGVYLVTFNSDVDGCSYDVTPWAGNGGTSPRITAATTGGIVGTDQVRVGTLDPDGVFLDGGFSLAVTC